jgi:hypothetical protein
MDTFIAPNITIPADVFSHLAQLSTLTRLSLRCEDNTLSSQSHNLINQGSLSSLREVDITDSSLDGLFTIALLQNMCSTADLQSCQIMLNATFHPTGIPNLRRIADLIGARTTLRYLKLELAFGYWHLFPNSNFNELAGLVQLRQLQIFQLNQDIGKWTSQMLCGGEHGILYLLAAWPRLESWSTLWSSGARHARWMVDGDQFTQAQAEVSVWDLGDYLVDVEKCMHLIDMLESTRLRPSTEDDPLVIIDNGPMSAFALEFLT